MFKNSELVKLQELEDLFNGTQNLIYKEILHKRVQAVELQIAQILKNLNSVSRDISNIEKQTDRLVLEMYFLHNKPINEIAYTLDFMPKSILRLRVFSQHIKNNVI